MTKYSMACNREVGVLIHVFLCSCSLVFVHAGMARSHASTCACIVETALSAIVCVYAYAGSVATIRHRWKSYTATVGSIIFFSQTLDGLGRLVRPRDYTRRSTPAGVDPFEYTDMLSDVSASPVKLMYFFAVGLGVNIVVHPLPSSSGWEVFGSICAPLVILLGIISPPICRNPSEVQRVVLRAAPVQARARRASGRRLDLRPVIAVRDSRSF